MSSRKCFSCNKWLISGNYVEVYGKSHCKNKSMCSNTGTLNILNNSQSKGIQIPIQERTPPPSSPLLIQRLTNGSSLPPMPPVRLNKSMINPKLPSPVSNNKSTDGNTNQSQQLGFGIESMMC